MKRSILFLSVFAAVLILAGFSRSPRVVEAPGAPNAVIYEVDKAHSQVMFKVRHLGISTVTGHFRDFDMDLSFDPEDLRTLKAEAVVDVNSVDTGIERRDNHLRSADFFEVEAHPTMTFVSREIRNINGSKFQITGDLTIKGTTKPVVLDAELLGTAAGPDGKERAAFTASTTINRKDFGLMWDNLTEAGGIIVGSDVNIVLEVQAIRQA